MPKQYWNYGVKEIMLGYLFGFWFLISDSFGSFLSNLNSLVSSGLWRLQRKKKKATNIWDTFKISILFCLGFRTATL